VQSCRGHRLQSIIRMRSSIETRAHDAPTTHIPARARDRSDTGERAQIAAMTSLHAVRAFARKRSETFSFLVGAMHGRCRFLVAALSRSCRFPAQLPSLSCSPHRMKRQHRKHRKTTWKKNYARPRIAPAASTTSRAFPDADARMSFAGEPRHPLSSRVLLRCCAASED